MEYNLFNMNCVCKSVCIDNKAKPLKTALKSDTERSEQINFIKNITFKSSSRKMS